MITLLLKPLALSFLLHFTSHHLTHKDYDDSYDPAIDNFQQLNNPDLEGVLDADELPSLLIQPEVEVLIPDHQA